MDTLTLEFTFRPIQDSSKTERKYVDFVVSGQSLGKSIGLPQKDLIGTFGWTENTDYENKQVDEFLGLVTPELNTGRTCFYVCPECGDIGCGAITAEIEITDEIVTWKNFGYENNFDSPNLIDYKEIGPFTFNKNEYIKTIEKIKRK